MNNQEKNVATWEEVYDVLNNFDNRKNNKSSGWVFSILSLFLSVIPFVGIPFSIVGFVKGIKSTKNNNKVRGTFSIILGIIGFIISCFAFLIWLKVGLSLINQIFNQWQYYILIQQIYYNWEVLYGL